MRLSRLARGAHALALCATLVAAPSLQAQGAPAEGRVKVIVDYTSGLDIYLGAGTDHGLRSSDTLPVYDGEGSDARLLGRIHILSATARRSVGNPVGERFPLERGATVYLGVPAERLALEPAADTARTGAAGGRPEAATAEGDGLRQTSPAALPLEAHGRASLDFDALRSTTRWGDGPEEQLDRNFNTPTFRLQARVRHLPGGLELNTGLRLAHRISSDSIVQPETSARIYELDLEKRFQTVPLEMHLGRFFNPFEEFSGYWDGALLRVGPESLGAGVAVGFEPERANEGFSGDRPKFAGFLDFETRREALTYSGSVSVLGIRPSDGLPDRTALGLSQRLRLGRLWLHQRMQVDREPAGGGWDLTRLQVDGSVPVQGGLNAFAGWRRWRSIPLWDVGGESGPRIDRGYVGASWFGRVGGGSVDVSLQRPEDGDTGRTLSGSLFVSRTPLRAVRLAANASHWSQGDESSLLLSPEIRASLGRLDIRGAYRFYRTSALTEEITTQFGDLGFTLPLGAGAFIRIQGTGQWGGNLSSTRLFASIWKAF